MCLCFDTYVSGGGNLRFSTLDNNTFWRLELSDVFSYLEHCKKDLNSVLHFCLQLRSEHLPLRWVFSEVTPKWAHRRVFSSCYLYDISACVNKYW